MREYETLFLEHPETSGQRAAEIEQRLRSVIASQGGNVLELQDWGLRELAYPIRHQKRGRYFLLRYECKPGVVEELERNLKLIDEILRYVTVRIPETIRQTAGSPSGPTSATRRSEREKGAAQGRETSEAV